MHTKNDTNATPETAPAPGQPNSPQLAGFSPLTLVRTAIGGLLMGMANLIPGVSGGTMILAVGLYEEFIDAIADLTALRFSVRRIVFLVVMAGFAGSAILGLSTVIIYLLLWHTSIMFALFIGLTLGGAPLLVRMIGKFRGGAVVAMFAGLVLMVAVALLRQGAAMPRNTVMDFVSGLVGSTTMVLPGISGSYMLLIMDQYDRVIGAISDLRHGEFAAVRILIPVGIGVVVGIVGLSNLLKVLLHRYERVTLGFLLGMLLGSVLGLWPFGRAPTEKILTNSTNVELRHYAEQYGIGATDTLEGEELAAHIIAEWPNRTAPDYTFASAAGALIAFIAGLIITAILGRLGESRNAPPRPS